MTPERRLFLRPNPQQTLVHRYRVKPVPEQRPQLVGQREVGESLAVQPALTLNNLQPHRPQNLAVRALHYLEFRNALGQIGGRVLHGFP